MTLTQKALLKTSIFVVGTIGIGSLGSLLYFYFPHHALSIMGLALYGFFVYLYYGLTRSQLESQARRIEQALKG
jgi:hypothetical protein